MPLSFAEWEAQRKGGGGSAPGVSAPDDGSLLPAESTRYQPGGADASEGFGWKAAGKELARTAGETAIGLARSPVDILKGLFGLPGQVVEGAKQIGNLAADPSLLLESGRAAKMGIDYIGDHPREGGSLIGQMLLAPKVPEAAKFVAEKAPAVVGKTVSAVGRGAEAVGGSAPARGLGALGALEEAIHGRLGGTLLAAVPPALEYGGRALQSVGDKIANVDVMQGLSRAVNRLTPGEQFTEPTAADGMRTDVEAARNNLSKGMSRKQANQRAGYGVKSVEVPYDRTDILSPSKADLTKPKGGALQGIEKAISSPDELDSRINGVWDGVDRRMLDTGSTSGTNRRMSTADDPLAGSVAERIARMRQEDPNIDAKGAEMFRQGYHGKRAGSRK